MSTFKPNDKVVCIDATPIPIGAPNNNYQDFEFPDGYIKEYNKGTDLLYKLSKVRAYLLILTRRPSTLGKSQKKFLGTSRLYRIIMTRGLID